MARWFSVRPALTLRGRKFKGIRGFAGKPFHPPLTDIPVTCYVLFPVFDLISFIAEDGSATSRSFFKAGTYVAVAGLIVSVPTVLTGFWDWLKSTPNHTQAWRTVNTHGVIMLTVTALVVVNLLMRSGDDWASVALTIESLVVAGLVSVGATYGGTMVYDYGFNVETSKDHPVYHESEEDVLPGQH
jgi:uncharacterized membrane protein